ncbi:hypothetical protein CPC08DRAFT_730478 [Agrocybe pediades]|nr:hypothetical protein CPC08DRAFT_730478 [Agrocybe pediades]
MSSTEELYSISQEKQYILANLNSTLIFHFLLGIYTGLFAGSLYMYFHKENRRASRTLIIIGNLTLLYVVAMGSNLLNWFSTSAVFVTKSAVRYELFFESVMSGSRVPVAVSVLFNILQSAVFLCADSLLVQKDYLHIIVNAFANQLRSALTIANATYNIFLTLKPQDLVLHTVTIGNRLMSALYTSSALTTLVTTSIICFKINNHVSVTISRSRQRYRTVIDTIIQSSALYSTSAILMAIFGFVHQSDLHRSFNIAIASIYLSAIHGIINARTSTDAYGRTFDTEVFSSALTYRSKPCTLQSTGAAADNRREDIEMQPYGAPSLGTGQDENDIIMIVNRHDFQHHEALTMDKD